MHNIMINSQNQRKLRTATHRLSSLTYPAICFRHLFRHSKAFLDLSRPLKTKPYQRKHTNLQKVLKWSLELSNQDHQIFRPIQDFFKVFKRSYDFLQLFIKVMPLIVRQYTALQLSYTVIYIYNCLNNNNKILARLIIPQDCMQLAN